MLNLEGFKYEGIIFNEQNWSVITNQKTHKVLNTFRTQGNNEY